MKWSVKKTIGGLGFLWAYGISTFAVIEDVSLIGVVLWPNLIAAAALYGIKKFGPSSVNIAQDVRQ